MKKTLLTLALVAASAAAFAQGKIKLANDGGSAITLSANNVMAADAGVAGQPIVTSGPALPSGIRLSVGLYIGTSSSSLSLASVLGTSPNTTSPTTLNPASGGSGVAGVINSQSYQINGIGSGTVFCQVKVWDSAFATYEAEVAAHPSGDDYLGANNIFTITLGTSISYPSVVNGGGSTWAAVGNESPLIVSAIVPEPGTIALAGLGAAAMLIFRRRK